MNEKIAIIDALGAHGSSHHLYLFGQAKGLKNAGVDVTIYTNNITKNPNYEGVRFYQFYKDIFRGRVMSIWIMVNMGSAALGSIIFGLVSDYLGIQISHILFGYSFIFFIVFLILFNKLNIKTRTALK